MCEGSARVRNHDSIGIGQRRMANYADWRRQFVLSRATGFTAVACALHMPQGARPERSLSRPCLVWHTCPLKSRNALIRPLKTFFKCLFSL